MITSPQSFSREKEIFTAPPTVDLLHQKGNGKTPQKEWRDMDRLQSCENLMKYPT
jgi:hypothetical protein